MIPKEIIIHHSASGFNTTITLLDSWHFVRGFPKSSLNYFIGYHYVILEHGEVIQTRRDIEIGAHCPPNDGRIGVCLMGNFTDLDPTPEQLKSLTELTIKLKILYNIDMVFGHRDCNKTECPGDRLYIFALIDKLNWLQKLIISLFKNH